MSHKNERTNLSVGKLFQRVEVIHNLDRVASSALENRRQLVILDPQRPGDRRCLARILAQIAWRLVKEQAAKDVVSSAESRQNPQ
jgi:hypothetical protein